MNVPAIHPSIDLTNLSPERLAAQKGVSEEEKVTELARQFEAILLRQILKGVEKTVIRSDLTEESTTKEIYQDLFTSNLAECISRAGGLGLAESLKDQLAHQVRSASEKLNKP